MTSRAIVSDDRNGQRKGKVSAKRRSAATVAEPKTMRTSDDSPTPVDADERRRLIEFAAYRLAEQRGFDGGDPMQDWLAAEAAVDASLRGGPSN